MPHDLVETGTGLLFLASGFDPVLKWDGVSSQCDTAGVLGPTAAVTLAGTSLALGPLVNQTKYWAAQIATYTDWLTRYQALSSQIEAQHFSQTNPITVPPGFTVREYLEHLLGQYQEAQARQESGKFVEELVGPYFAYLRFVDKDGNYSNLSPVSANFTPQRGNVTILSSFVEPFQVTSPGHGLSTGDKVIIKVRKGAFTFGQSYDSQLRSGLVDAEDAAAPLLWTITVLNADVFTLDGSVTKTIAIGSGTPQSQTASSVGGSTFSEVIGMYLQVSDEVTWEIPAYGIVYTNVQVPVEGKVVRRQLLRNISGEGRGLYVDIDTYDLTSTTFTSLNNDTQLAASQFVPLIDTTGKFLGFNRSLPFNSKKVFVFQGGRMFALVDAIYEEGSVSLTFGSATVTGIGTEWKDCFKSRFLHVLGGDKGYEIIACSGENQTLTLIEPYRGATDAYAVYAIRPQGVDQRQIYYSGAGLPEAWDPFDGIALNFDGDDITGGVTVGSFLYVLEHKHVYRLTFDADPGLDGRIFASANRGCVNSRCAVEVENQAYMLDRSGVYVFGGNDPQDISMPIRDLFSTYPGRYRINWRWAENFHGVHFQAQETVLFFVALDGARIPRHALCFNYRSEAWYVIEFAFPIGSSDVGYIDGREFLLLGGAGKRVLAYPTGNLDGPDPVAGTVRGAITGSTWTSFTDSGAVFGSDLVGNPVTIVAGRGKGQTSLVASVAGTRVNVTKPWQVVPDTTSKYQLGGMTWHWKSGKFWYVEDETNNPRKVAVAFDPTAHAATMDMRIYLDRSATPLAMQRDYNDVDGSGVSSAKGSPDLTVDLTWSLGYAQQRMDARREVNSPGNRAMALELQGAQSHDAVVIHEVVIDGAK